MEIARVIITIRGTKGEVIGAHFDVDGKYLQGNDQVDDVLTAAKWAPQFVKSAKGTDVPVPRKKAAVKRTPAKKPAKKKVDVETSAEVIDFGDPAANSEERDGAGRVDEREPLPGLVRDADRPS